jgi:hypothetical protein
MSTRCPELASIRKVIDLYIDGVQNGNLEAMAQAFHPQSSMFGYKGKDLFVTPIQGLYDYIAGTTPPAKAGAVGKAYTCSIPQFRWSAMPPRSRWRWMAITSMTLPITSNCSRSMGAGGSSASCSTLIREASTNNGARSAVGVKHMTYLSGAGCLHFDTSGG